MLTSSNKSTPPCKSQHETFFFCIQATIVEEVSKEQKEKTRRRQSHTNLFPLAYLHRPLSSQAVATYLHVLPFDLALIIISHGLATIQVIQCMLLLILAASCFLLLLHGPSSIATILDACSFYLFLAYTASHHRFG